MILSESFVFLRVPKTGSTFVSKVLHNLSKDYPELGIIDVYHNKHDGKLAIPESYAKKPVIITLRHPVLRYLSRYHFPWWKNNLSTMYDVERVCQKYPLFPEVTFDDFLEINFNPDYISRDYPHLKSYNYSNKEWKEVINILRMMSIGLYSITIMSMLGLMSIEELHQLKNEDVELIAKKMKEKCSVFLRTECLNEDIIRWLSSLGINETFIQKVQSMPRVYPKLGGRKNDEQGKHLLTNETVNKIMHYERIFSYIIDDFGRFECDFSNRN